MSNNKFTMFNVLSVCCVLLLALMVVNSVAYAERYSATVKWEYANPPSDLQGFVLECWPAPVGGGGGVTVISSSPPAGVSTSIIQIPVVAPPWEYNTDLDIDPAGSVCVFRAVDKAGNEAPNSDPVYVNPPPPRVTTINIIININGGDVSVKVNKNNQDQ